MTNLSFAYFSKLQYDIWYWKYNNKENLTNKTISFNLNFLWLMNSDDLNVHDMKIILKVSQRERGKKKRERARETKSMTQKCYTKSIT